MKLKKIDFKFIVLLIFIFTIYPFFSNADVITPTLTKVYFEKDGKPYNDSVNFTMDCYGYSSYPGLDNPKKPGTYNPEKVFSFSSFVKKYGDKIFENYYLNYRKIDYCNISGKLASGEDFLIKNFSTSPIIKCEHAYLGRDGENYLDPTNCINSKNPKFDFIAPIDYCQSVFVKVPDEEKGYSRICELKVNLPKNNFENDSNQLQKLKIDEVIPKVEETATPDSALTQSPVKKSFTSSFRCFFRKLFGKGC